MPLIWNLKGLNLQGIFDERVQLSTKTVRKFDD